MSSIEPFRNRVWRCVGAALAGSVIGSLIVNLGFVVAKAVGSPDASIAVAGTVDAYSFLFAIIALSSLVFMLPSAILVLLPIEMRLRDSLAQRPVRGTFAIAGLAAAAGLVIVLTIGIIHTGPPTRASEWAAMAGALATTLPFSISAAFVLAWLTRRAINRARSAV